MDLFLYIFVSVSSKKTFSLDASTVLKEEQVLHALQADQGSEARLSLWSVEEFTQKGDNYATLVTALNVSFVLEGEEHSASYVVKINPKMGVINSIPGFSRTMFEKESEFYCAILPSLNDELRRLDLPTLNFPKCYHSDLDSHNEAIFIEDLRGRGFRMYDRMKGLDKTHTTLIVQELARLHAASLLMKARTPDVDLTVKFPYLNKDWNNICDDNVNILEQMFRGGFELAETFLQGYSGYDRATAWLANAQDRATEIFTRQVKREAPFEVLCHGDLWNNNILFR